MKLKLNVSINKNSVKQKDAMYINTHMKNYGSRCSSTILVFCIVIVNGIVQLLIILFA